MRQIHVFYFSCAPKLVFEICKGNKNFKGKKKFSKHIVSFDFEIFNLLKSEQDVLSDNIEKKLKRNHKKIALYLTLSS